MQGHKFCASTLFHFFALILAVLGMPLDEYYHAALICNADETMMLPTGQYT
jgi:hypothetical protein